MMGVQESKGHSEVQDYQKPRQCKGQLGGGLGTCAECTPVLARRSLQCQGLLCDQNVSLQQGVAGS